MPLFAIPILFILGGPPVLVATPPGGEQAFIQQTTTTDPEGVPVGVGPVQIPGVTSPQLAPEELDQVIQYLEDLTRQQEEEGTAPPPSDPPAPAAPPVVRSTRAGQGMEFRFTNAPIETVISTIMQELGYSYLIDPQVSGTVNLYTAGSVPKERLFELLEQILKMNGHAIVRQQDFYIILPLQQSTRVDHNVLVKPSPPVPPPAAPQAQSPEEERPQEETAAPPPQSANPAPQESPTVVPVVQTPQDQLQDEQGVITYIIPLHYLPSGDMLQIIQPFVSQGATVLDFTSANILIINDFRRNIEQVLTLVRLLDTEYFDINTVDLIPIRYHQAKDVAEDLGKVFAPTGQGAVRLVAIERLNSILVVAHSAAVFQEVQRWVERLDIPASGTNIRTFVYQVENNTAMNIAEILAQLYQDGFGLPSPGPGEAVEEQPMPVRPREPGFVPGFERDYAAGMRFGELGPSLVGRRGAMQGGVRAVVSGNIKIVVNEFNNSLIVQATEADYQFLLQTIKELDVLPRQVLIEANIYAVELRDDLSFGVAAFLEEAFADVAEGVSPGHPTTGGFQPPSQDVAGGISLVSRAFIGDARQLRVLINALRSRTNVEIVEAPRLLAMDGMQARINVGAEVPVTQAAFSDPLRSGTTGFINQISFRPTGTTLLIIPRISASGIVTMELAIEVSSATGTALTPTINRNYVETSLIVGDGQTVAIGGIISDSMSLTRARVPLLGDIPIVGAIFGQTTRDKRRSELLFLITPRVVRNLPTATELTLDFRRALRNAYDYILRKERDTHELQEERRQRELQRQVQ